MQNDLTSGSISKTLLSFSIPYFIAALMQALYGAVDMYVVGQYSGTSAISAVNIGSQIMLLITSFVIGIAMGTTVTLGRHIGAKDYEKAGYALGNTIVLFGLISLILLPTMYFLSPFITSLMNTPQEAIYQTIIYTKVCSIGIPFIVAFNVSASILRGMGDSKTPMFIVGIACIINICLDFLLTGYLHLDVLGVALATSLAQAISSFCGIIMMIKKGFPFSFKKSILQFHSHILNNIVSVGLPIAMQDTLINISFMIITIIANTRGLVASSAVGVVEKIIGFMFLVPSSMLSSISAITAQNMGAGKIGRIKQTLKLGIIITCGFGMCMCLLSWICPKTLISIFSNDFDVIEAGSEYLKTYSIDCILVGFTFCLNGYLSGMSKSMIVFIHNTISIFLVRVPLAYIFSLLFPTTLFYMGLASPCGSLFSILILSIYFKYMVK